MGFTSTIKARALTVLSMLMLIPTEAPPPGLQSRRAMLAMAREESADVGGPVKDIAVGCILLVISLVIALTVYPILTSSVATAQDDANTTATQSTLLGLLPTLLIVILVVAAVGFMVKGLRGFANK